MKNKLNGEAKPKTIICNKCGKRKKLDDMAKHKGLKFGIRPYCKPCWNAYLKRYRTSPKGKIATADTNKRYWNKQSKELNS